MINQIVQWTLLPAGLTPDGFLTASLFVSPRLRSDEGTTLAGFPDFVDWPGLLGGEFQVTLQREDGATAAPRQVLLNADSRLWQALFLPETLVRPFQFDDYADRPIITYPVLKVLDHLKEKWARLAVDAIDELPLSSRNASPIGPALDMEEPRQPILSDHFDALRDALRAGIFEGVGNAAELSGRLVDALGSAAAQSAALRAQHNLAPQPLIEPFGGLGDDPRASFYRLMGFHRRPEAPPAEFPAEQDEAFAEIADRMEFHHLLSSIGDHPDLLRRLGLVIDLVFPSEFVPERTEADAPGMVRAIIERTSSFPTRADPAASPWSVDVSPWTLCRLETVEGGALFSPSERPSAAPRKFVHGLLHLDPAQFSAVAVDVDGLALKGLNMAATLDIQEASAERPIEEPAEAGVPTPRSGGVGLVQTGHGTDLHLDFYQARANNDQLESLDPDNPPVLAAEDLVRGYRMDVLDEAFGAWRSLTRRRASYRPLRDPNQEFSVDDEGLVQVSVTGEVDRPDAPADPDGALYAHEALLTWDGWSQAARRPETAIPQEPPAPAEDAGLGPLSLDIAIAAGSGSLPQLRFGRSYKLRVRAVDLAGNALTLEQATDLGQLFDFLGDPGHVTSVPSEPLTYRRFEPVAAPDLVPRRRFGPGEGIERLVIRSNFDISAEDYALASEAAADPMLRYVPFCDRHVAPAKASLQLAELHGMFDEALSAVRDLTPAEAAAAIQPFYAVASRESGSFRDLPGAEFIATGEHDGVPQGYVVLDADEVDLPYLPDPFCGGAVLRIDFDPAQPTERHELAFATLGQWHELRPIRIRLVEGGPSAGFVDPAHREFVISLPRGRTARLRLNSLFNGDPDLLGIAEWCRSTLFEAEAERVVEAIKESRHWMATPWRTLELVHATQQPLAAPEWSLELETPGVFSRPRDRSIADLAGQITLDAPSTARVDLVADWEETVDDPSQRPLDVAAMVRQVHAPVFSIALPEPFGTPWSDEIAPLLAIEEQRVVQFHTADPEQRSVEDFRRQLLAASAAAPTVQERNRLAAAAAHLETFRAHDFGDTRYRRVRYQMLAATRFREYFDPALPAEAGLQRGNVVTVEMLNCATPPVPVLIDIVPLLRWEEAGTLAGGLTSQRQGQGLRVWLRRPWFSTGAGEMLGLICDSSGIVGTNSPEYRDVTYMARDPLHAGIVPLPLGPEQFVGVAATVPSIEVKTQAGTARTEMVAYRPEYDPDQDAWYCDVRFETGTAYFPFVRLGLVRYQPNSIPGCLASRVTPAYFIQPLPDRSLTVTAPAGAPLQVSLRGPAPTARMGDGAVIEGTNLVAASIEQQDPRVTDPALGWTPIGEETLLAAQIGADGIAVWTGEVPRPAAAPGRPTRLAVREYELHLSDNPTANALQETRRLVHADLITLEG